MRKDIPAKTKPKRRSWAIVGVDTSLACIAACAYGYDASLDRTKVSWNWVRWTDEDYFTRLGMAACAEEYVHNALSGQWVINIDRIFIFIEEPWYYGATKVQESSALKQQAEISGAFKGGLVRWGFPNIAEINNQQWKAPIRQSGYDINKASEGGKWDVKHWAIDSYKLPNLPDLVSVQGVKVPRPTVGLGVNSKAVQPEDIYDACAIMHYGRVMIAPKLKEAI